MDPRPATELLLPWIERLLDEEHGDQRERILARAALEASVACGSALWRRVGDTWQPRVGTGLPAGLPSASEVEAVANGLLGRHLPPDRVVLAHGDLALTLVGVSAEEDLTPLDALLGLAMVLDDASPDGEDGPAWPLSDVA